jgi:hypothetical protein
MEASCEFDASAPKRGNRIDRRAIIEVEIVLIAHVKSRNDLFVRQQFFAEICPVS